MRGGLRAWLENFSSGRRRPQQVERVQVLNISAALRTLNHLGYRSPVVEQQVAHALHLASHGFVLQAAELAHRSIHPHEWRTVLGSSLNNL